jgi:hypothetical protein
VCPEQACLSWKDELICYYNEKSVKTWNSKSDCSSGPQCIEHLARILQPLGLVLSLNNLWHLEGTEKIITFYYICSHSPSFLHHFFLSLISFFSWFGSVSSICILIPY